MLGHVTDMTNICTN